MRVMRSTGMLHHLSFGVSNLDRAAAFYDAVLSALGYVRVWSQDPRACGIHTMTLRGDDLIVCAAASCSAYPASWGMLPDLMQPAASLSNNALGGDACVSSLRDVSALQRERWR